ncbi:hypothetical protein quinque_016151 [Culex quinquefasciatus]
MSEMSSSPSASARISLATDESHFSLASLNSTVSQDEFFRNVREHSELVLKRMQEMAAAAVTSFGKAGTMTLAIRGVGEAGEATELSVRKCDGYPGPSVGSRF